NSCSNTIHYQKLDEMGIADENDDGGKSGDSRNVNGCTNVMNEKEIKSESDETNDPGDGYQDGIRESNGYEISRSG
ncbi:16428_t:CDS:2, partial [Racocetra fulgida]